MASIWTGYDDKDDNDDADRYAGKQQTSRDCLIIFIDLRQEMFDETVEFDNKQISCITLTMKAVYSLMCTKCIAQDKDYMSIVFLNAPSMDNEHNFENIVVWQSLDLPNAPRARQVLDLAESTSIRDDIEAMTSKFPIGSHPNSDWKEAFWLASLISDKAGIKFNSRRVFLFTNDECPHRGNEDQRKRIVARIKEMKGGQNWSIELLPPTRKFSNELFWKEALDIKDSSADESFDVITDYMNEILRKDVKKRSIGNISFEIGQGCEINVCLYNLIAEARIPTGTYLEKERNDEVKPITQWFNKETGEKLIDREIMKMQKFDNEEITFETSEVETMRRLVPQAMKLLGFKPIKHCVKDILHIRPGLYIHPDDTVTRNSSTLYTALLRRCVARQVAPICRLTPRANMAPRVVALLPHINSDHCPAGFHAVFLPFADDIRDLSKVTQPKQLGDASWPKASQEQVDTCKQIVEKLTAKNYSPENFSNPTLQHHYAMVEAMAMNLPEMRNIKDTTKPDVERIQKRAGALIDKFISITFPIHYNPERNTRKKAAQEAGTGKKDKKIKIEELDLAMAVRENLLESYTIKELKDLAKNNGLVIKATKKAEIIAEIGHQI